MRSHAAMIWRCRVNALIAMMLLCGAPAIAGTRLSVDEAGRGLLVRVEADAPEVMQFNSDDVLPIRWDRQGVREAILPAIALRRTGELSIADDSRVAHALDHTASLPRLVIDPALYARDAAWHGQPSHEQRLRYVLLGVLFSLGLLLLLLVRRHAFFLGVLYCLAWAGALSLLLAKRPGLVWAGLHPELPVSRVYATARQTLRVPIRARSDEWIPIVESPEQLRALAMRVEVRGEEAELVAELPKGSRLYLTSMAHADRLLEPSRR